VRETSYEQDANNRTTRIISKKKLTLINMGFEIFAIGDLHIESMEQSKIFYDYLNLRAESLIVLLGDVIHFTNSIWNESWEEMSQAEREQNLEKDMSIWEDFLAKLRVPTVYYFGSHERYALRVIKKLLPSRKLNLRSKIVFVPKNLELIELGSRSDPLFLTGLHIPDNIHPNVESEEFLQRKRKIEEWIEEETKNLDIPEPSKTILSTHDPCDFFYRNMGYRGLTEMLERCAFKVHYHAHIHSNIRQTVVGKTQSVNRSFVALCKLNQQALEPSTSEIRSLYGRNI